MTTVNVLPRNQTFAGLVRSASAYMKWKPNTAAMLGGGRVLTTQTLRVDYAAGDTPTANLEPCDGTAGWCWEASLYLPGNSEPILQRYVLVPNSTTAVAFDDLQDVDPTTLIPVGRMVGQWRDLLSSLGTAAAAVPDGIVQPTPTTARFTNRGTPLPGTITLPAGPRGLPGVNAVPAAQAVADYLGDLSGASATAVRAIIAATDIRPRALTYLFCGSSTSHGAYPDRVASSLETYTAVKPTLARVASGGIGSAWMVANLPAGLATARPDVVFLQGAPNDGRVDTGISAQQTEANFRKMIAQVLTYGVRPVLTTATPIDPAMWGNPAVYDQTTVAKMIVNNATIRRLGTELGLQVIDLYATFESRSGYLQDGVHLNTSGLAIAGQVVAAAMIGFPDPYPPEKPLSWSTIATDTFTRANSATMGSTETGGLAWTPASGGTWGISNDGAYAITLGTHRAASLNSDRPNQRITADLRFAADNVGLGLFVRGVADGENIRAVLYPTSGNIVLEKVVGGTPTVLTRVDAYAPGTTAASMRLEADRTRIRVYVNDTLVLNHTLSDADAARYSSGRLCGLWSQGAGTSRLYTAMSLETAATPV